MNTKRVELEVCEVFRSIAGETSLAGLPASFVRLAGCNLRCAWCDTRRAWEAGRRMFLDKLLDGMIEAGDRLVVVTGGEPLLQSASLDLCRELLDAGKLVALETNGSLDITPVPQGTKTILDIKTPSSGESKKMDMNNLSRLEADDEVKFVIADRDDFDWAQKILGSGLITQRVNVLFSPASPIMEPGKLADWVLESRVQARLQIQLHRVLWPDGRDGVQILDPATDFE